MPFFVTNVQEVLVYLIFFWRRKIKWQSIGDQPVQKLYESGL